MRALVPIALACLVGCSSVRTVSLPAAPVGRVEVSPAIPVRAAPTVEAKARGAELPDSSWRVIAANDRGHHIDSNSEFCPHEFQRTDGRFVFVNYTVTNRTDTPEQVMNVPSIMDSRGRSFVRVDSEFCYVPPDAKMIGFATLEPGVTQEFWTIIEVPADAKDLRLHVKGFRLIGPEGDMALDLVREPRETL